MVELTATEFETTKATYKDALDKLLAHQRAVEDREKAGLVGRYYKRMEQSRTDPDAVWPVYLVASELVDGRLHGWYFQRTPGGDFGVAADSDIQPGFLSSHCVEIERGVFVVAFNELLTAIARFAHQMPDRREE